MSEKIEICTSRDPKTGTETCRTYRYADSVEAYLLQQSADWERIHAGTLPDGLCYIANSCIAIVREEKCSPFNLGFFSHYEHGVLGTHIDYMRHIKAEDKVLHYAGKYDTEDMNRILVKFESQDGKTVSLIDSRLVNPIYADCEIDEDIAIYSEGNNGRVLFVPHDLTEHICYIVMPVRYKE